MKIVSFKLCPFVQRVTAHLELNNLAYDVEYIDIDNKPEWFLSISPNAQVPVLITDDGMALFESDAIVEYLEETHEPGGQENTTPERRAVDRAWSYQASKHYLTQCNAQQSADELTLQVRSEPLNQAFSKVEQALGDGPFFNGQHIGRVDMAWLPILHRADLVQRHTCYDFLGNYPRVKRWQSAILNTGVAQRSVSDDFEVKFREFYLSQHTYLGQQLCCDDASSSCDAANCC